MKSICPSGADRSLCRLWLVRWSGQNFSRWRSSTNWHAKLLLFILLSISASFWFSYSPEHSLYRSGPFARWSGLLAWRRNRSEQLCNKPQATQRRLHVGGGVSTHGPAIFHGEDLRVNNCKRDKWNCRDPLSIPYPIHTLTGGEKNTSTELAITLAATYPPADHFITQSR